MISSDAAPSASVPAVTDIAQAGAKKLSIHGDWLAAGEEGVWLSGEDAIYRLEPATGKTVATIPVPEVPCQASDVGLGWMWTTTCAPGGLSRIDPATNTVSKHIELDVAGSGEGSIGAEEGAVWVAVNSRSCQACRIAKIDAKTMKVLAEVPVTPGAAGVRAAQGSVWVTNPGENVVEEVDPKQNKKIRTVSTGPLPRFLAIGEGAVWPLNQGDGSVTRVEPATGDSSQVPVNFTGDGGDMTSGAGWIWARGSDNLLGRLDPETGRLVEEYGPSSGSGAVIVGFGAVWVSAHDVDTVWRLPLPT